MHGLVIGPFGMLLGMVIVYHAASLLWNSLHTRNWKKLTWQSSASLDEEHNTGQVIQVFRLAKRRGGKVKVSDVVIALGITPKKAENLLLEMSDGYHVVMDVDSDGHMIFTIPDFLVGKKG
ncbi:hypothetical protein [Spirochaeta lutea]|uniref:Uncharacterized protein n=1 Tax=Spirochaeta lutea TaxID=1480694 RepID=A0A098R096_9SPIO|nr:hypothetical protein [Spirochaeta lutea]KGE73118.1 hypothetical protein DC28_05340 [Spirochaeta lutea]